MRYRKILSARRVNLQRKIISKPAAEAADIIKPTGSSSEYVELEEETICEQSTSNIIDAQHIQNLQEIINQQKFKLKQSETEISSLKKTLHSSMRNNRLTKIKIDKQTLLNRKLNEQLSNVNKILHDHLFLSLDNAIKVKFYEQLMMPSGVAPRNGNSQLLINPHSLIFTFSCSFFKCFSKFDIASFSLSQPNLVASVENLFFWG